MKRRIRLLYRIVVVLVLATLPACGGKSSNPGAPAPVTLPPHPIWTISGQGNQVFDMPNYVIRCRIQGTWNRTGNSNFIVHVAGRLIVNEILRDSITYDGVHIVPGGVTETVSSNNIAWTFTEIQ